MNSRGLCAKLATYTLALATLAITAATIGCGIGQMDTSDNIAVPGSTIQGLVHGGQNPVSGASVKLMQIGTTGYGSSGGTPLATATTGSDGSFTLSAYTCPSSSTQVYIIGTGGNPGLTPTPPATTVNNASIALMAALGSCGSIPAFITVNEVTTAAAAFALGQYFTTTFGSSSADSFGSPSTAQAQLGIANAFLTASNLASNASGAAQTAFTVTGAAGTVTATPETDKLQTIADILASCVNSDGLSDSNCSGIFSAVAPSSPKTPTDVLQAAVLMSLYPTSGSITATTTCAAMTGSPTTSVSQCNIYNLFGYIQGSGNPFPQSTYSEGTISVLPTDWTLGINYTNTSSSTITPFPLDVAADSNGNIWLISNNNGSVGSLTELSPAGAPLFSSNFSSGTNTTLATPLTADQPRNLAIDTNNNIWIAASTSPSFVVEYNTSTATATQYGTPNKSFYGIAIDGSNNVFAGLESSSTTTSTVEFLGGTLAATSEVEYGADISNTRSEYLAVDTAGNVWSNGGSAATAETNVVEMTGYSTSACNTPYPCTSPTQTYTNVTAGTEPFGFAAGPSGAMYVANVASNNITNVASGTTFGSSTSVTAPHYLAVDGAGNIWVANKNTGTAPNGGTVSEFGPGSSSTTAPLSPIPYGSNLTPTGFQHQGLQSGEGITIDPSGNVWVASNTSFGGVEEIVGAAAPTVTPIALALKNGTVGVKP